MYGYIYLIVNKTNGKTYVGKHKFRNKNKKDWKNDSYMGSGYLLGKAKEKYGIGNFEKFLICYTSSLEDTNEKEIFWIAEYRKRGKAEYNITNGGEFGYIHKKGFGPRKGQHHSEETKKKMSESHKGKAPYIHTPEINEKIGAAWRGKTWVIENNKRVWKDKQENK